MFLRLPASVTDGVKVVKMVTVDNMDMDTIYPPA
jgi:hypothetical protein